MQDGKENEVMQICAYEDLFDEIYAAHIATGHEGEKKTYIELKKKFDNIHRNFLSIFIQFCQGCQEKRTRKGQKNVVVKPIISKGFMHRGQVDLFDLQSIEYDGYKWGMHYQDHSGKISICSALKTKCAKEVA